MKGEADEDAGYGGSVLGEKKSGRQTPMLGDDGIE